ncbi:MAG: magnesium transporter CorA family protein [Candidatus Paceibacterota bacterium]|jgi:magnesium transporter
MISIYKKTLKDNQLLSINDIEKGCWISVTDPSKSELADLERKMNLDATIMEDGLDDNEIPRIHLENGTFYLIIRFPMEADGNIITVPLLVCVTSENIITMCKRESKVIAKFIETKLSFCTTQKTQLLLKIILEIFGCYENFLSRILKDIKHKKIKINNLNNNDILYLVQEEETLNDFEMSLAHNINVLEKILSGRYITLYEKDKDITEDLFMDSKQTLEMSKVALKSIRNIREAYSTILSNELNKVIKVLTGATIVITIPNIVGSLFGMNVAVPFANDSLGFYYILLIIAVLSLLMYIVLFRRKWI